MDDFDRFLEMGLRGMLDPVVASRPPVRRGTGSREVEHLIVPPADAIPATETVAVTASAVAAPQA